jgi:hypothetical protein
MRNSVSVALPLPNIRFWFRATIRPNIRPKLVFGRPLDAEQLLPLPSTQVVWVLSLVLAKPTIIVEKVALFCNPASGGKLQALQLQ